MSYLIHHLGHPPLSTMEVSKMGDWVGLVLRSLYERSYLLGPILGVLDFLEAFIRVFHRGRQGRRASCMMQHAAALVAGEILA